MTFTNLSLGPILLGLAALGVILYLLQRLRVRHRRVTTITTLFWREAVEETRRGVLVRRFRHPLTYLLLLLICALLWLAVAGPRLDRSDRGTWMVLIDGSAAAAQPGVLESSLVATESLLADLPSDRTHVRLCADRVRPLLGPDESRALLRERLGATVAAAAPSSVEDAILDLRDLPARPGGLHVVVIGDTPVREDVIAALPDSIDVRRVPVETDRAPDAGIVALGIANAASGRWDRVDAYVHFSEPTEFRWSTGDATNTRRTDADAAAILSDLPADGGTLEVEWAGVTTSNPLNDVARIALPDRPAIRVTIDPGLTASLAPLLEADPAVLVVSDDPDVRITAAETNDGPALVFTGMESAPAAFEIVHTESDGETLLDMALHTLGLDQIDATAIADQSQRVVEVRTRPGDHREVRIWAELLTDAFDFTGSRAFPLLIARSLRWLAETPPLIPRATAGRTLGDGPVSTWTDEQNRHLATGGLPFTPPRAGAFRDADGRIVWSSFTTVPTGDPEDDAVALLDPPRRGPGTTTWILSLVALLLALEWFLVRTERIP